MPVSGKTEWRIGYDSTQPASIPRNAEMIFPYVPPSRFAWTPAQIAMFPRAAIARITVHGDEPDWQAASIIDVEGSRRDPAHFSFTPHQAREFVVKRNQFRPDTATVYCSLDKLPRVQEELQGLHWWLFLAHWDNEPGVIPPYTNIVAKQYRNGAAYDTSVVYDANWHPFHAR